MPRRLDASARSARQVRLRPHRSSPPATTRHSGNDQLQPTSVPPTIAAALLRSTMRRAATPLPRYRGMPRESPLCFGRQSFCRAHKFEAKPFGGLQRGTIHQLNAGRRRVQGAECVKILPRLQVHKSAVSRPPFRRIMGPRGKRAAPRTPCVDIRVWHLGGKAGHPWPVTPFAAVAGHSASPIPRPKRPLPPAISVLPGGDRPLRRRGGSGRVARPDHPCACASCGAGVVQCLLTFTDALFEAVAPLLSVTVSLTV